MQSFLISGKNLRLSVKLTHHFLADFFHETYQITLLILSKFSNSLFLISIASLWFRCLFPQPVGRCKQLHSAPCVDFTMDWTFGGSEDGCGDGNLPKDPYTFIHCIYIYKRYTMVGTRRTNLKFVFQFLNYFVLDFGGVRNFPWAIPMSKFQHFWPLGFAI